MASSREEKVRCIFQRFDANGDGGLDGDEMAALMAAVNPRVKFTHEQIAANIDEVHRTYSDFIAPGRGLTCDGLLRTYDDGAGDLNRDFDFLFPDLPSSYSAEPLLLLSRRCRAGRLRRIISEFLGRRCRAGRLRRIISEFLARRTLNISLQKSVDLEGLQTPLITRSASEVVQTAAPISKNRNSLKIQRYGCGGTRLS